jgi:hypothetical protein
MNRDLTLALQEWERNYIGMISIPLLRSWCVKPTSHRNLGMFRFMKFYPHVLQWIKLYGG